MSAHNIRRRVGQSAYTAARFLVGHPPVRFMYDSYDGSRIPGGAGAVAGYTWWLQSTWDRFRGKLHILVATQAYVDLGDVLDVETGDATPAQAPGWIRMRRAAGYHRPTIYCSASVIPAVRKATGSLQLGVDYDIWAASWSGGPHQVPGCALTQYYNEPSQAYDLTVIYDEGWPHRKAPAAYHRRVATGLRSLDRIAKNRGVVTEHLIFVTRHAPITTAHLKAFNEYVAHGTGRRMPIGMVWYSSRW
jgi:hypothetical protein